MEELMYYLAHIDTLLLIFCRITMALQFIPIMIETKLPAPARVGISVVLSITVFSTITFEPIMQHSTTLGFFIVIMKELVIGIILSFGVAMFFQVYSFVGQLWSMQGGLGMSTFFDPASGSQTPLLGRFYYLAFSTIFLVSGGYHWFIQSLVETFQHIPIGHTLSSGALLGVVVNAMAQFWMISFKLASPILAIIFIVDCGLGILARTVPQMNMFVIGLPLKLIILLVMLVFTLSLLPAFNDVIIRAVVDLFYNLVQGLSTS